MSLLGDMLKTAGDAMRLAGDVMRYQMERKTTAVKRGATRIGICIAMGVIALGFVGAGMGLLLYGSYVMVASKLGPGASGLLIGFGSILLAGLIMMLACGAAKRP